MVSLCFYCSNARADKCKKIANGTPIKGWVADDQKGGGYIVRECPRFKKDESRNGMRVTIAEIADLLEINERTLYRRDEDYIKSLLKARGHKVKIVYKNKRRYFFLKDE